MIGNESMPDGTNNSLCDTFGAEVENSVVAEFQCLDPLNGQYLVLYTAISKYLEIDEVYVGMTPIIRFHPHFHLQFYRDISNVQYPIILFRAEVKHEVIALLLVLRVFF